MTFVLSNRYYFIVGINVKTEDFVQRSSPHDIIKRITIRRRLYLIFLFVLVVNNKYLTQFIRIIFHNKEGFEVYNYYLDIKLRQSCRSFEIKSFREMINFRRNSSNNEIIQDMGEVFLYFLNLKVL